MRANACVRLFACTLYNTNIHTHGTSQYIPLKSTIYVGFCVIQSRQSVDSVFCFLLGTHASTTTNIPIQKNRICSTSARNVHVTQRYKNNVSHPSTTIKRNEWIMFVWIVKIHAFLHIRVFYFYTLTKLSLEVSVIILF